MTRQLLQVAAGVVLGSGLMLSSSAMAAVSLRPDREQRIGVEKKIQKPFGRQRKLPGKRRMRDTTAVLMPEGPFQGRATVAETPDTVMR